MRGNELIKKIRKLYLDARKLPPLSNGIMRCTNRIISAFVEDLFALYIKSHLRRKHLEIWIDPQITIPKLKNKSKKRIFTFRPDICIYNKKKNQVIAVFELKMDIGYKRDIFCLQVGEKIKDLNRISFEKGKMNYCESKFTFAKGIKWKYIIVSTGNAKKQQIDKIKRYFKINKQNTSLFILNEGDYLNSHKQNIIINPCKRDFERLEAYLKNI